MKKAILTLVLSLTLGNSAFAVTMLSGNCPNSTPGRHDQTAAPAPEANYQNIRGTGGSSVYEGADMSSHSAPSVNVTGGMTRGSLTASLLRGN